MERSPYAGISSRAEAELGRKIQIQGKSVESFGAVSQIRGVGKPSLGFNSPISFTHTSASGAAETVKLGDPHGAVAALAGVNATAYTSGTPYSNSVLNQMFISNPMTAGEVNYEVGATSQFSQSINYGSVNVGGTYSSRPLQNIIQASKRNTQQNALLLTLDFSGQGVVFDANNALFITVAASGTITQFTINPAAVAS